MRYRALLFKNESMAVRLLVGMSDETESMARAFADATAMKQARPEPEIFSVVVSKETKPSAFV